MAVLARAVLILRSALFNVGFYAVTAALALTCIPLLWAPRPVAMVPFRWHAASCSWLLAVICGVRYQFRGLDNIPKGAALIASKHQSAWETFGLVPLLDDPCYVMKAELARIPLYGSYAAKFGMIFVSRERQAAALRDLLAQARERIAEGRQIIIFPEATRREPGAPPAYKPGAVALYEALGVPCVPVALNSGLVWPRRQFLKRPGTIVVEFLPALPPGLPRAQFSALLQERIELATSRLLIETRGNVN